jgi:hypothetical protein
MSSQGVPPGADNCSERELGGNGAKRFNVFEKLDLLFMMLGGSASLECSQVSPVPRGRTRLKHKLWEVGLENTRQEWNGRGGIIKQKDTRRLSRRNLFCKAFPSYASAAHCDCVLSRGPK